MSVNRIKYTICIYIYLFTVDQIDIVDIDILKVDILGFKDVKVPVRRVDETHTADIEVFGIECHHDRMVGRQRIQVPTLFT